MSSTFWIVSSVIFFGAFVLIAVLIGSKPKVKNSCCMCKDHKCTKGHDCCDHRHDFFIE